MELGYLEIEGMSKPMIISAEMIVENFKYLGSFVQKYGSFSMDVKHNST
jgi:hypothetical protein